MAQNQLDLAGIFQTVTQTLAENQQALNQADEYNQDHGDNMVQTFQTITDALHEKKGGSDSAALAYASRQVAQSTTSGSGQLYAQNLAQAAEQFQGQRVDAQGALQLLQTLIGGAGQQAVQPASPGGGDMLSQLLGGLAGGEQPQAPVSQGGGDMLSELLGGAAGGTQAPAPAPQGSGDMLSALFGEPAGGEQPQAPAAQGGDMLSQLLGGMTGVPTGSSSASTGQSGFGLDDLLAGGMAFLQARQSGGSNVQALVQAFMAASGMGSTVHREQSTQMVVNSFLQALTSASGRP